MSTEAQNEMKNEIFAEVDNDRTLENLASEKEIGVEQLRTIGGTEGLDDETLIRMWEEAKTGESDSDGEAKSEAAGQQPVTYPFKVYGEDGKEITDFSKLTIDQLFGGKAKIGYKALDKEHQKDLAALLRTASFGHYNETRLTEAQQQANAVRTELEKVRGDLNAAGIRDKEIKKAFDAVLRGDNEPLRKILEDYQKAGDFQFAAQTESAVDDPALVQEGMRVFYEQIVPAANEIAIKFGANAQEVQNAVLTLLDQSGDEISPQRIEQILHFEIPYYLEEAGYSASATAAPEPKVAESNELAEVRKELAELRARLAGSDTAKAKEKLGKVTPAAGRGAGIGSSQGSEIAVPDEALKSMEAAKRFLRGR